MIREDAKFLEKIFSRLGAMEVGLLRSLQTAYY